MTDIQNFRELLSKGLYFHNLVDLERFCTIKLSFSEENFLVWYILKDIFHQLQILWETYQPISKIESDYINAMLLEPIDNLLDSLETEGSKSFISVHLEEITKKYFELSQNFRE